MTGTFNVSLLGHCNHCVECNSPLQEGWIQVRQKLLSNLYYAGCSRYNSEGRGREMGVPPFFESLRRFWLSRWLHEDQRRSFSNKLRRTGVGSFVMAICPARQTLICAHALKTSPCFLPAPGHFSLPCKEGMYFVRPCQRVCFGRFLSVFHSLRS